MKAIRIHGVNQFQLDEINYPDFDEDDALVRVKACGVCGTDLAYIAAGSTVFGKEADGPSALGHEAAGEIIALGANVGGFEIGDRVVMNPVDRVIKTGIGNGAPEGAFAEVVRVRNMQQGGRLLKIPQHLPYEIAALAEPMGVALHAVNRSAVKPDTKVAVVGVGPIGLGVVIWLKHKGVGNVIAIDLSRERLQRALAFGADGTIQAGKKEVENALEALHGQDVTGSPDTDIFIDAAGSQKALEDTIRFAKKGAKITIVAIHKKPVSFDLCSMVIKEITVTTAVGYPKELEEVVSFLADNKERMQNYISDYFSLDAFDSAIQRARQPDSAKVMVCIES